MALATGIWPPHVGGAGHYDNDVYSMESCLGYPVVIDCGSGRLSRLGL